MTIDHPKNKKLAPKYNKLIIDCVTSYINHGTTNYLLENDPELINCCIRHQIINLFQYSSIKDIRKSQDLTPKRYLVYQNDLKIISDLLGNRKIGFFIFKGIGLADSVYKEFHHRFFQDLDIFIHEKFFLEALNILEPHGFKVLNPATLDLQMWINKNAFFTEGISVLHGSMNYDFHPFTGNLPDINFELISKKTLGGVEICYHTITGHTNLVLLCAHARKHLWSKLIWIVDIALIINSLSNVELNKAFEYAHKNRTLKSLRLSIFLIEKITGKDFKKQSGIVPGFIEKITCSFLTKNILVYDNGIKRKFTNLLLHFFLEDRTFDSLKFLFKRIFVPTRKDFEFFKFKLPRHFFYILRVSRIIYDIALAGKKKIISIFKYE